MRLAVDVVDGCRDVVAHGRMSIVGTSLPVPYIELGPACTVLPHPAPAGAQVATWAWIKELGARKAEDELGELYKLGTPPRDLDGPTEGILVTPLIQGAVDRVLGTITGAWMPWLGKAFDSEANRGYNRLASSARWPAKLLWPLYGTREEPGARAAFDF